MPLPKLAPTPAREFAYAALSAGEPLPGANWPKSRKKLDVLMGSFVIVVQHSECTLFQFVSEQNAKYNCGLGVVKTSQCREVTCDCGNPVCLHRLRAAVIVGREGWGERQGLRRMGGSR